jgi:hypothetical protein
MDSLRSDSETARRKDEQGRDSGGVARRYPGPDVLGGSAGVGQEDVLLSHEAPCVPPRNLRQFVEVLLDRDDKETRPRF